VHKFFQKSSNRLKILGTTYLKSDKKQVPYWGHTNMRRHLVTWAAWRPGLVHPWIITRSAVIVTPLMGSDVYCVYVSCSWCSLAYVAPSAVDNNQHAIPRLHAIRTLSRLRPPHTVWDAKYPRRLVAPAISCRRTLHISRAITCASSLHRPESTV
jgi:hypothetical protein